MQLINCKIGVTLPSHDLYIREQNPQFINNKALDDIHVNIMSRLSQGLDANADASVIKNASIKLGGLEGNVSENQLAFIEEGWSARRGVMKLEFVIDNQITYEERLVVLGYLVGGNPMPEVPISADARFIPVKTWTVKISNVIDASAMPVINHNLSKQNQFLYNDPRRSLADPNVTIRPTDIKDSVAGHLGRDNDAEEEMMKLLKQYGVNNVHDNENLTQQNSQPNVNAQFTSGISSRLNQGMILSRIKNNNPISYTEDLLTLSINSSNRLDTAESQFTALVNGTNESLVKEDLSTSDPFLMTMFQSGVSSITSVQGFTLEEIGTVFTNMLEDNVLDLTIINSSGFREVDNREISLPMGTGSFEELIAMEINMILFDLMTEFRIMSVGIIGTNNPAELAKIPGNTSDFYITYQPPYAPITDQDPNFQRNLNLFINELGFYLLSKYCDTSKGGFVKFITFSITCQLFGESEVEIVLGDSQEGLKWKFPTTADNRVSTILSDTDGQRRLAAGLFTNLQSYFNFNGN